MPFQGKNMVDIITRIRQTPPPAPQQFHASLPDAFGKAIMKLLAKKPEDRYQNAGELLVDLGKLAKA